MNSMDVEGNEKILKTKTKTLRNISENQKFRRGTYIQKLEKLGRCLRKSKEWFRSKINLRQLHLKRKAE